MTDQREKGSRLTWAAAKDGIAHAAHPGHGRTLCNVRSQDPRWAWPEQSRCADCQAIDVWPTVRRINVHRKHEETRMTTLEPRIERKPMKPKARKGTELEFGSDLTVRLSGETEHLEFASRSALEDVLTGIYRQGAALGWVAGRQQLQTTGVIYDDKEIVRDEAGHIVGLRTRRMVAPVKSLAVDPKGGQA